MVNLKSNLDLKSASSSSSSSSSSTSVSNSTSSSVSSSPSSTNSLNISKSGTNMSKNHTNATNQLPNSSGSNPQQSAQSSSNQTSQNRNVNNQANRNPNAPGSAGAPQQPRSNNYNNNHNNNNNNNSHGPHHHHHPTGQHQQPRPIQPNYNNHHHQQQQQHHHHQAGSHHQNRNTDPSSTPSDNIDFRIFENIEYPFCPDYSKYEPVAKIGQGTFGEVYKARCKKTNEFVALKKVLTENEKEGFPITALREIKILQVLNHENIVRLIEICTTKANAANKYKSQFYLVFEFCEHDLAGLLSNQVKFTLGEQKKIMQQLLNGLYYIHNNCILHRDMKTANILVTKDGKLKLADFGLARAIEQQRFDNQPPARYTNRVVTLWYRPPELLLGERCYNKAIDMWGSGCIMAELWTREPILKGNSEPNQLELIQSLCGSITPAVWPDCEKLELYNKMNLKQDHRRRIKERLGPYIKNPQGLELLEKLLTLDPKERIDSNDALDHDFFWTEPLPCDLKLDKLNSSMFEFTAQKRQQYRQSNKPVVNEQHYDRVY